MQQPFTTESIGKELEAALNFIGDGTTTEHLKVDEKDQPALDKAIDAAKLLSRAAATWSILDGILLLVAWIPLFVIACIFQTQYPGYGALFWALIHPAMAIVAIVIGIIAWIVPKEKDGYLVLAAQIGFFVTGALNIAGWFHWLRSLLDLIYCAKAGFVASLVPLTIGTFGDHTAICASQGLVIAQFIFNTLIMISSIMVPILIGLLIARKNRVAAGLYKLKIGSLADRLLKFQFLKGVNTQETALKQAQIGKKIHDLVARASDHGNVIPHLRKTPQELAGHMGVSLS